MARVVLIDNVDSFTYNVADLLHRVLGRPPVVWRHDHLTDDLSDFEAIVVGPGPGRPQHPDDMGLSTRALQQHEVPVLGVCLGHQGLGHLAGDDVVELAEPVHGRVSEVLHDGTGLFEGLPSPFPVVRYHSLEVRPRPHSPLTVVARAGDDGSVMALADTRTRRWGVQFHPESVLSEHGTQVLANFFRMSRVEFGGGPTGAASAGVADGDVHRPIESRAEGARQVQITSTMIGREVDTWALHQKLFGDSPTAFWLDASDRALGRHPGTPPSAACSVLGDASGPFSYVLTHQVGAGTELSTGERLDGPLLSNLAVLRDRLEVHGAVELPTGFRPGFVGYLGYELKAETGGAAAHRSPHPDARLVLADRALVIDHEHGRVHAVWLWDDQTRAEQDAWVERVRGTIERVRTTDAGPAGQAGARRLPRADARSGAGPGHVPGGWQHDEGRWQSEGPEQGRQDEGRQDEGRQKQGRQKQGGPGLRLTREAYLDLIAQCQQQIRAGESYEICLTNAATWPGPVDETRLAAAMRQISPVPFAAWLRGPGPTVLSASPERFVSVSADGCVEARPIKGTRPRGVDPLSDAALAEELRTSIKERAENLMIVDLLRNDLHRVCRSGSVHVPGLFEVESYATVHQLVSTVRGQLAEGMDCLDVIGACFPGGSMTGAPKVRTMQILDRLEAGPRGVYSGALGWIGLDGSMDLSIVIRTVTLERGVAEFGVGGAITALSDPEEEYAETLVKADALTRALGASEVAPA